MLAYHHGYDNVKRWGDALEDYRPDNEQEFRQDVWNNEVGAKIGALARITGMTIPELGDAVKEAFRAGSFQTDAYAPFSGSPTFRVGNMKLSVGSGAVTLPDGSRFDLTNSGVISVDGVEYPLLQVIRRDGSVQNNWTNMEDGRTLFQGGTGKWELPENSPALAAPQGNKRSENLDTLSPVPDGRQLASSGPPTLAASPAPAFSKLISTGPDFPFANDDAPQAARFPGQNAFVNRAQASPPLQPDEALDAADNGSARFFVARSYDPSQGSPFAKPSVAAQPSPDGSLSLNGAYLEYLMRLNAV